MTGKVKLGLQMRKEILGDQRSHPIVNDGKPVAPLDEFNFDQVKMFSENVWAGVWGRDGLAKKQRSLLTLGILAGLKSQEEFALHVHGALNNGVTVDELREICIQIAAYCGGPTGFQCLKATRAVLRERGFEFAPKSFDVA